MSETVCTASEYSSNLASRPFLVPTNESGPPSVRKALTSTTTSIMVDSADMDPSPNPFQFSIDLLSLGATVRNADSVELKSLVFPKVAGQSWVGLDIRQVTNGSVLHTSTYSPFATVFFSQPNATPGTLEIVKGSDYVRNQGGISPPLRSLTRLDCSFTKQGGAPVTSADTGGVTDFQFVLDLGGRVVGVSQALESSMLDDQPHHSMEAYRP